MSAKKVSAVRKEPSDELLQAFLQKGDARLGDALRVPDIRLVTQAERQATAPSPATVLQEQVAEAVQVPQTSTEAPRAIMAPVAAVEAPVPVPVAPAAIAASPEPTAPIPAPEPRIETVAVEQAPSIAIVPQPQTEVSLPTAAEPEMQAQVVTDAMSLELPAADGTKAQHLYGRRGQKAVDFNLSITQEQAERLNELTAYEMLRTRSKHSISEIVRHLLDFALHHVEENRVIPTADGLGLHKPTKGA